jgi:hypothetical protein
MGTGGSFLGVKWLGHEADHTSPSSAEVKEWVESYLHSLNVLTAWCLVKHRDNFTFTATFTKVMNATDLICFPLFR